MGSVLITKEIVEDLFEKKILLGADFLGEGLDWEKLSRTELPDDLVVLNQDSFFLLKRNQKTDWKNFEKLRTEFELGKEENYFSFVEDFKEKKEEEIRDSNSFVGVVQTYKKKTKKYGVQDFVHYFIQRYKALEKILRNRQELKDLVSINRLLQRRERQQTAMIGMVAEKNITKNGNFLIKVEDLTGSINVLISKNKKELFNQGKDLVLDEVIGITGNNGDKIVFANSLVWPDVPMTQNLKKTKEEVYALVLSDLHIGSDCFLPEEFGRFLKWIRGEAGSERQKELASQVKYIFICGDLVDGVGIYPNQESELVIKDIYKQYEECARLLKQIPKQIKLIISPGNHDALRLSEPQPELPKDFAQALFELPNTVFVSNPATVTIHKTEDFPGFDILVYHGYSFDYYYTEVESLRTSGAMHKPYLISKYLLKRRHLAPTHTSTLYIPDTEEDPLVINKIPDIIVTGHIHKPGVANYKNITIVSGGCWQGKTNFQAKVGHDPEPGKVPLINLQTREIKILKFI